MFKKQVIENKTNNALLNLITPMGLKFNRNNFIIGDNKAKIFGILKYPQETDIGWMSRITNMNTSIVSMSFTKVDPSILIDNLNRNISVKRAEEEDAKDALTKIRARTSWENSEKLMYNVDQNDEAVGIITTTVMPFHYTDEGFNKVSKSAEATCKVTKCKIRNISMEQNEALKHISPFYTISKEIEENFGKIMPISSFVGGLPFSSSGHNDKSGYVLGRDSDGGLVIIDIWKRGSDRTNSNFLVLGVPGVGKSATVKSIAISEYMMGSKLIIIDPEREYKSLTKNLNGDWLNTGGGSKGMINPLQIVSAPVDAEEESDTLYTEEEVGMGDMALHLKTIEIFFNLYIPNLTDIQLAMIKKEIISLYNKFNIYWETDIKTIENEKFPIFTDLYKSIEAEILLSKDQDQTKELKTLLILIHDLAYGSDSFMWNGHTTINPKSRCVCLDTHDLQGSSDRIKRTQYFLQLTWAWQQMSANRNERVVLICDEAYLVVDPNVPQSLIFMRNIEKRSRKYESAIGVISHSVNDFLDPQVKMYGQAILDVPCYKIIMGTDGQNLKEMKNIFDLTEAEEHLLLKKARGQALFMFGSRRMSINIEIPEYKLRYFGAAGGR